MDVPQVTKTSVGGSYLNRYKLLLDPSKLKNHVFLGRCSKWNSNFQNFFETDICKRK